MARGVGKIVLRRGEHKARWTTKEPPRSDGSVEVRTLLTGVDGTDEELVRKGVRHLPKGRDRIVLGHEALVEAAAAKDGDVRRYVPLVRRGCGACQACRSKTPDLCLSDGFTEHGIKGLDGFMQATWKAHPEELVPVPDGLGEAAVLAEPLSIVIKGFGAAAACKRRLPWFEDWSDQRILVLGSGSLGSLATLFATAQGATVWTLDRHGHDAGGAAYASRLGATHVDARETSPEELAAEEGGFDLVVETSGAARLALQAHGAMGPNGVTLLLGLYDGAGAAARGMGRHWSRLVRRNQAIVGSVNSNASHFRAALAVLEAHEENARAAITHQYAPQQAETAFSAGGASVVKKVIRWDGPRGE